mmetsp:Transcript_9037/g.13685  ORF Transcript_9037/g.13685 Transcript_9037/m.13685 type:complete len:218 (+) Transcript_9037:72-725(+)
MAFGTHCVTLPNAVAQDCSSMATTYLDQIPQMITSLPQTDVSHLAQTAMSNLFMLSSTAIPEPLVIISTIALVTASDMVPFVPCQPLAIALGAKMGVWAYPLCVVGQSLAGVIAFTASRKAANSDEMDKILESLNDDARVKFEEFRRIGIDSGEGAVLLSLIGLRLAPFFPFSAGNYLLGSATSVGLRPFVSATLFGCLLSNLLSVSVGIGGSELLQ